jgi:micrococcal nuclease
MNRRLLSGLVLVLAAVLVVPLLDGGGNRRDGDRARGTPARVLRAVDGDTLVASAGGRTFYVRLLGIDTPETHRPGTPVECGGPEASASMRALVPPGAQVRLETDPGQDRVDRYGRLLAYVWLPSGRLLEEAQLESGWASTYVFEGRPVSLFPRLAAAARAARRAGRGAWSRCGGHFHSASG